MNNDQGKVAHFSGKRSPSIRFGERVFWILSFRLPVRRVLLSMVVCKNWGTPMLIPIYCYPYNLPPFLDLPCVLDVKNHAWHSARDLAGLFGSKVSHRACGSRSPNLD